MRRLLLEPALFGYAVAGLVAIHAGTIGAGDQAPLAPAVLHFIALRAALLLAAWRTCLQPAVATFLGAVDQWKDDRETDDHERRD